VNPAEPRVTRYGRISFDAAEKLQVQAASDRADNRIPDTVMLMEFDPVITMGKSADQANILVKESILEKKGVALRKIDRGGDVTYHGPGQAVMYPIVDIRSRRLAVRRFVHMLEEVMIRTCSDLGVNAYRKQGIVGAWCDGGKIGAIGLRISRGVSRHGAALNVNTDIDAFGMIVPCGIRDAKVTSIKNELGRSVPLDTVFDFLEKHFVDIFSQVGEE